MSLQHKSNVRYNSTRNNFGVLWTSGWLADQCLEFKEWAAQTGKVLRYNPGQFVYHAGESADGVYGLRSGALEVEFSLIGDDPVSLLRTTEGFWIGDSGLLSEQKRIVSIQAVEECSFVRLAANDIRKFLQEHPKHWMAFYDLSHRNVALAVNLLAEALSLTVRARACRRLLDLSETRVEAPITQDALAKVIGVARPTLRRSLNSLVELGAIELRYRRVAIVDREVLKAYKDEQ